MTAKARRHPSQRPVQFNYRPYDLRDLEAAAPACSRRNPCGVCDRCEYEASAAVGYADHPFEIASAREIPHL